jgi:ATP-dependent protease HslVU (ClpYQ) peptidase subunit
MFEKCITCNRIGESCIPNLLLLPFPELIKWCDKRQKHLGWSNQKLADKTKKVPVGTINRIKASEEDCKFSTMQSILISLFGGTTDEFACTEQVEKELRQMEQLEQSVAKLAVTEAENAMLKERLSKSDDQHRNDIRAVKEEYQKQLEEYREQVAFLKDELMAWRSWRQKQD